MSKDLKIDLEHKYLFNIPREIRELKKILSKYRGTRREIGLDDVLDCIFYLVAAGEGYIDRQEIFDYLDSFTGYDPDNPTESLAIDAEDVFDIAQTAEHILDKEGAFLGGEVAQVESRNDVFLYSTESTQIGNTGYVEVKVLYQRHQAARQN